MAQEVLLYLSLIIGISALMTVVVRFIKQPPIIAYLIAGIIVGPLFLNLIGTTTEYSEIIQVFAHIGVAFLLFIVGLSLDFRVLKEMGAVATSVGLMEIIVTGAAGFLIAIGLGFNSTSALYLGAALAFSSTVLVVKILSDKKEIDTLHGRIALGILIIEDFVAAIVLMAIPLLEKGSNLAEIGKSLGMVVMLIIFIFAGSALMHKRLLDYLARHQESLFLFGIAWALILATLFDFLGFSLEIGALIAGMSLASSKYTLDLGGKIKPLRDFFVVLFFVFFGSQLAGTITPYLIKQAILFSAFIIIGKPLIIMILLTLFGYTKKTNFLVSSSLAQISEFSLILILLGFNLGHLNQETMSLVVLIALITICASSYSIYYAHPIFNKISHLLNIFDRKKQGNKEIIKSKGYEVILIGYHRIGYKLLQTIKKVTKSFFVIDYNPKVILALSKEKIDGVYGDAGDKEFLNEIGLEHARLIISTIPDEEANIAIREMIKRTGSKAIFIATAEQPRTALDLYEAGVDYVIIPHHLGGDYASHMIEEYKTNIEKYKEKGRQHYKKLKLGKDSSGFE